MDKDGYISNGELFQVLKMMVGSNLKDAQLQQIVDKTIIHADSDGDGKISFEEFCSVMFYLIYYGLSDQRRNLVSSCYRYFSLKFGQKGKKTYKTFDYI